MADETFTNRRGMGCEKKQQVSPSDEAVDAFGPVLMEGPAKRQGEGWKGMKPWNDRFAAAQASARASSLLLRLTSPAPVSPHSFGGGSWGRFLVLRSSALLCYPKGVQGTPESIWKLEQVARQLGTPTISRVTLQGSIGESLADFADQAHFDLIVVGSKGRGAVARVLIGSTTDRLVHISRRPVLVVR